MAAGLIAVAGLMECKSSQAGGIIWNNMFSITVPTTSTDITQGQTALVRVVLSSDEGFKQTVRLEIRAPRGLNVEPNNITLRLENRESDVQLRITADRDARLGERTVVVLGTPDIGQTVEAEFRVNVTAK